MKAETHEPGHGALDIAAYLRNDAFGARVDFSAKVNPNLAVFAEGYAERRRIDGFFRPNIGANVGARIRF